MSSLERRPVRLSRRARDDFTGILRFTAETWGLHQLKTYRDRLDEALLSIRDNPEIGHRRDDLPKTHRVLPVGAHVIVYRIEASGVGVVRILHQRMTLSSAISSR